MHFKDSPIAMASGCTLASQECFDQVRQREARSYRWVLSVADAVPLSHAFSTHHSVNTTGVIHKHSA